MFNAQQFRQLIHAEPFKPFRVRTTDGRSFEVPHRDCVIIGGSFVQVATDFLEDGLAIWTISICYVHIVSVEEIKAAA
jgi:hypothetical protein